LKPSLFKGKRINVQVDSREGITFGQTVADWYGGLKQPANVEWINEGDAQGFFDLLTERIARLP
ncbi:nucleoside hydrolase, partial [Pseudomonas aeruginosa]|nr:nucleoside hydrolase [Pseudomonas aeruginosa]